MNDNRFSLILLLLVLPIGLFYSPNLSIYVLGSIREGIVAGWLFANFTFVIGLGIMLFMFNIQGNRSWGALTIFIIILAGLTVLHWIPAKMYWHYISLGSVIRDETGMPVVNPSKVMFVWHLSIASLAIIVTLKSIVAKFRLQR